MNFHLGGGYCDLIYNIIQTKVYNDYDIEDAIKFLKELMPDIDNKNIAKLLSGLARMSLNKDQTISIVDEEYDVIDYEWFIKHHTENIREELQYHSNNMTYYGNYFSTNQYFELDFYVTTKLSFQQIYELSLQEEIDYNKLFNIELEYRSENKLETFIQYLKQTRDFINYVHKIHSIFDFLEAANPDRFKYLEKINIFGLELQYNRYSNGDFEEEKEKSSQLENYVNAEIKYSGMEQFDPVNILDGYDAGWLAPNGDFYGLNGEIANFLHLKIADKLQEKGLIPSDEELTHGKDSWLEENNWVRISKNWILYDGYNHKKYMQGDDVPLTDIQKDLIYRYGQTCCKGVLQLGYSKQTITTAKFGMTEPLMIRKYFEI